MTLLAGDEEPNVDVVEAYVKEGHVHLQQQSTHVGDGEELLQVVTMDLVQAEQLLEELPELIATLREQQ